MRLLGQRQKDLPPLPQSASPRSTVDVRPPSLAPSNEPRLDPLVLGTPRQRSTSVRAARRHASDRTSSPVRDAVQEGPYTLSRSIFSKSTPTILRGLPDRDSPTPPLPTLPSDWTPSPIPSPSSSGFFSCMKRRPHVAMSARQPKAEKRATPVEASRARTRSFSECLGLSRPPNGEFTAFKKRTTPKLAPELPPLPPMSALQFFDDGAGAFQRTRRTPRKSSTEYTHHLPPVQPLVPQYRNLKRGQAPATDHQHIFLSVSQPVTLTPLRASVMGHSSASGTAPTMRMPIPPQLDAIWEGFLAETSGQDASLLDLCGALRTTSSLDSVLHSPSTRSNGAGTPTRSTSESLLPYLLRAPTPTPVSRKVFVSAGRSPSNLGDLRTSPSFIQRRATDTQIGLMTRIMSGFPLSPKTAPELPIPNELLYVPSRPAPQPPSASTRPSTSPSPLPKWEPLKPRPPLREQDTTPPKIGVFCGVVPYAWQPPLTTVPLRALPEPPRPGSRQRKSGCPATAESTTSSTTTVSSTYWEDDISDTFDPFDANSSRSSSGGWSSRTTNVSQHHSRSHSRIASPLLWPASPTSCEFFGPAVVSRGKDSDFRWGYAV